MQLVGNHSVKSAKINCLLCEHLKMFLTLLPPETPCLNPWCLPILPFLGGAMLLRGFPGGISGKGIFLSMQKTWVWSLDQEDPLEESMTTYSSILAWRIPWTEELHRPQSIGSQRVGNNSSDLACTHAPQPCPLSLLQMRSLLSSKNGEDDQAPLFHFLSALSSFPRRNSSSNWWQSDSIHVSLKDGTKAWEVAV